MPEWFTFAALKEPILFLLAIYGAVLSTINWLDSRKKDQRTIRVKMTTAMPTFGSQVGEAVARIEVTNAGHRNVTISLIALELPDGRRLFSTQAHNPLSQLDSALPITLADGQIALLHLSYAYIGRALINAGHKVSLKVVPVCESSTGDSYRGKGWTIDPQDFAGRT